MATLSDFLGGQQASPAAPQPGAGDPGYEERKAGWVQALKEMTQDPVSLGMMAQLGTSLANPRQGADFAGQVSGAMNDALRFKGRYAQMEEESKLQQQKQAREDKRVGLEERRAGLGESQLGLDRERLKADTEYRKERLEVDRMRARSEAARARKAAATSTSTIERVAAKLQEDLSIPYEVAVRRARAATSSTDPQTYIAKRQAEIINEATERAADPILNRDGTMRVPTPEEAASQAAAEWAAVQSEIGGMQPEERSPEEEEPTGAGKIQRVKTMEEAMALPPGTVFMTPDGRRKVR